MMSGCSIEFWVFRRHDPDVIDAIDQSDKRSAWETLKLGGISDSKEKEQIAAYRRAVQFAAAGRLHRSFMELERMRAVVGCRLDEQSAVAGSVPETAPGSKRPSVYHD